MNSLNKREKDIIKLLQQEKTREEIAKELNVSLGTVKKVLADLYEKFNCSGKTGLVMLFARGKLDEAA